MRHLYGPALLYSATAILNAAPPCATPILMSSNAGSDDLQTNRGTFDEALATGEGLLRTNPGRALEQAQTLLRSGPTRALFASPPPPTVR